MAKDEQSGGEPEPREEEGADAAELLLFQTNECYVYMIPPRKSSASYRNHTGMKPFKNTLKATIVYRRGHTIEGKRCEVSSGADEWNVNKWAWEGILRVISKGEECMVKLEDKNTGELYAQAFVRRGQPLPVEPVIDSSRYFALCIEENFGGRTRHAFIGIGFRERPEAYDFQAALYDHVKYLDKKQAAEEMEQQYQTKASIDYSLKEGQTLKLQLKKPEKGTGTRKSTFFEQELDKISSNESGDKCRPLPCLVPPPPPPAPSSPSATCYGLEKKLMPSLSSTMHTESTKSSTIDEGENEGLSKKNGEQDSFEDDFGDFQTAG